jgi:hypothetical protein
MAKSKKGPALFEVIRAAQQKQLEQQRKAQERQARESVREHAAAVPAGGTLKQAAAMLKSHGFWLGSRGQPSVGVNDASIITATAPAPAAGAAPRKAVFRTTPPAAAAPSAVPVSEPVAPRHPTPPLSVTPTENDRAAYGFSSDAGDAGDAIALPRADASGDRNDGLQGGVYDDVQDDLRDDELDDTPSAFDHPAVSYVAADDEPLRDHLAGSNAAEPYFREVPAAEFTPTHGPTHGHDSNEADPARRAAPDVQPAETARPVEPVAEAEERVQEAVARTTPPAVYAAPAAPLRPRSDHAGEAMRRVREEIAASAAASDAPAASDRGYDVVHDFFKSSRDPAAVDRAPSAWYSRLPRFSYGAGIAAGLGLVVLAAVALSVLLNANPSPAVAETRPDVLDLKAPAKPAVASAASPTDPADAARARPDNAGKVGVVAPKSVTPPAAVSRVKGHQYLVLISCRFEKDAKAMVTFLAENGVAATIESALPGQGKWHTVVTARGFERTKNNPEFHAFEAEITALMRKYNRTSLYAAKPAVYGWR